MIKLNILLLKKYEYVYIFIYRNSLITMWVHDFISQKCWSNIFINAFFKIEIKSFKSIIIDTQQ